MGTLLIASFAPPLAEIAFKFGPAEYFSLMVLGLISAVVLASGSLIKAIAMIILGLLLGMIGTDVNSGVPRFDFNYPESQDGIDFAIVAMGVFGIAEIMSNLAQRENRVEITDKIGSLYPNKKEVKESAPAVVRGTLLGSALGILPSGGAVLSSFASYTLEKKNSLEPERFGHGHPAGLAGPESANNATDQTSFIPILTLGIPSIQPGPQIISSHPDLFWV